MAKGEKISKLYWMKTLVARDSVNAMNMETSLWHQRLSHISEKRLNCLAKKDMLPGLKNADWRNVLIAWLLSKPEYPTRNILPPKNLSCLNWCIQMFVAL